METLSTSVFKNGVEATILLDPESLSAADNKDLLLMGVNLAVLDYAIVVPPECVELVDSSYFDPGRNETVNTKILDARHDTLRKLLFGGREEKWFYGEFRGKTIALGVAFY